jgi:hypothetical protein
MNIWSDLDNSTGDSAAQNKGVFKRRDVSVATIMRIKGLDCYGFILEVNLISSRSKT